MAISNDDATKKLEALRAHMLRHERFLTALDKTRMEWEDDLNFINGLINQPQVMAKDSVRRIIPSRVVMEKVNSLWEIYSKPERFKPE